jgi:hypothetical protein
MEWGALGMHSEGTPEISILMDSFRTLLRVEAITFFEDPAKPSSWMRDARLDYWDPAQEKWVKACDILADSAMHTHKLPKPVEAARFRVLLPWACVGNLRLGELVLHGQALGCSHPDAAAKKLVAVLFDEQDDFKSIFWVDRAFFNMKDVYSGGRSVEFNPHAQGGQDLFMVRSQAPYGHAVPNWDFEIVENPKPGQYRWLQWAWKAASPATQAMNFSPHGVEWPKDLPSASFYAGPGPPERTVKLSDKVPTEWKVERVDLWKAFGRDGKVNSMSIISAGGNMLMDQILLGATEKDLDMYGKGPAPAKK